MVEHDLNKHVCLYQLFNILNTVFNKITHKPVDFQHVYVKINILCFVSHETLEQGTFQKSGFDHAPSLF